jgi:hypothetical protein
MKGKEKEREEAAYMREREGESAQVVREGAKRIVFVFFYSLGHHAHARSQSLGKSTTIHFHQRAHTQRSSSLILDMTCMRRPLSAFQLKGGER